MVETCAHEKKQLSRRKLKNDTFANYYQCLDCGRPVGSAVASREAEKIQRGLLPLFDDALQRAKEQERADAWHEQQAQRTQQEAMSRELWWDVYNSHLASPAWKAIRQRIMRRDNFICQGCLERPACDVHHLTYRHLEHEFMFELIAVCRACHDRWREYVAGQDRPWLL